MAEFNSAEINPDSGPNFLAFVRTGTQPPLTFAGKRITTEDRLGSVNGSYYPYGQPKSGQTGTGERFATYHKDATGLEYAQNRYYSATWGRFASADPARATNASVLPSNWNRNAYVGGDPTNKTDPLGLCSPQDSPPCYSATGTATMPGSPSAVPTPQGGDDGMEIVNDLVGGGGGGSVTPTDDPAAGSFDATKLQMLNKIESLRGSHCEEVLGGVGITIDSLKAWASQISFASAAHQGQLTMRAFTGQRVRGTVSQFQAALQKAAPNARAAIYRVHGAQGPGGSVVLPFVVLFTEYFQMTSEEQSWILLHEALHYRLQMDDAAIIKLFGISFGIPSDETYSASEILSTWLGNNCRSTIL